MVGVDCVEGSNLSICEHIGHHYRTVADDPPVYFRFASEQLPDAAVLRPTPSTTGDVCHYSVCELSDNAARKWFKSVSRTLDPFYICADDGSSRQLREEDIADWP